MAIYRLEVKNISRGDGRSATGAAAYRAGIVIKDERTGTRHDFTAKSDVSDQGIILCPPGAPNWAYKREKLWNEVELVEKRKDSRLAKEILLAIPKELSHDQKIDLVKNFIQTNCVDLGMVADINYHGLESHNPHAHVLLTTRPITKDGFKFQLKNRDWNKRELLVKWRKNWEVSANKSLSAAGITERVDSRTLKDQGVDRIPQIHLGRAVIEMEKRGVETRKGNKFRSINIKNQQIKLLEEKENDLKCEVKLCEEKENYWKSEVNLGYKELYDLNSKVHEIEIKINQHFNEKERIEFLTAKLNKLQSFTPQNKPQPSPRIEPKIEPKIEVREKPKAPPEKPEPVNRFLKYKDAVDAANRAYSKLKRKQKKRNKDLGR